MLRSVLLAVALICLGVAACTKGGSQGSVEDAGRTGGSGATAGTGALAGTGAPGGSTGASGSGAGGSLLDASASDAPSDVATGSDSGPAGAGGGANGRDGAAEAGGGDAGGAPGKGRTGMKSAGCGKPPNGAVTTAFTNHRIALPACASCTVPNCPSDCISPSFVPGGVNAQSAANGETFLDRDFTIQLPKNYNPDVPSPVFFGADGCGPAPPLKGAGFGVPGEDNAIKVGLQQVDTCFADGGQQCAHDVKNVAACVNGPELPYFLAVQKWVEANFCVDLGTEFIGGGSSGAWQAIMAGCAAANSLRGFYSLAGGKREHRWACNGPIAAFMIVTDLDTLNPVGPLATINAGLDSFGAAPARDEILERNGCVGKATMPYDAKFPACVKYTGCPAAYPVVWCEFAGGSHDNPTYDNVNYLNAVAPFLLGLPPAP
jgi:hypothetical protein